MKNTNTTAEAIINFMYFANNFSGDQIHSMCYATAAPEHLKEKYLEYVDKHLGNGTQALFAWFMQLSKDNQIAVCNWITQNYDAFPNISPRSKTEPVQGSILKGRESEARISYLLNHEEEWSNPENKLKGMHFDDASNMFIVWDNTTGHCNVENFKKEKNAIAWIRDEEV